MADHYQNNIYNQGDYPIQEDDAASDVTEGHDEEDQMYEGEYQGIPHPDDTKAAQRAAW